ncbi:MAG: hypothetical protein RLY71_1741 [Pseudomonadota bacterium]|jgi:NADPH-dependent 2,4-dienoyl-CoA reductase/sulfur reductase-like enzyme/ferredoxin
MSSRTAAAISFRNFTELDSYLPGWAWNVLRALSVLLALGMSALLIWQPDLGLTIWWGLAVPALPLVFLLTPGIWRNVCPLATSNQAPRRMGISRGLTQKTLAQNLAFPIGIALLIAGVIGRKLLFNTSGPATAALILGAMAAAFLGGLLFKGKSGWCSSICPLLPVQRLYGQTPFIKVANTQCSPCVGCAKNCYDFNPATAYLADQYDPNPSYRNFRRFFAAIFPGLILGFYLVPPVQQIGPLTETLQMLAYMTGSLTVFTLLDISFGRTQNTLPMIFAAVAFNLYYWFSAPVVLNSLIKLGVPIDLTLVGALRAIVIIASLVWIARSKQMERLFLKDQLRKGREGEIRLAPIVVETVRKNDKAYFLTSYMPDPEEQPSLLSLPLIETVAARPLSHLAPPPAMPAANNEPATQSAPKPNAAAVAGRPELVVAPEGKRVALRPGVSLLDSLESCGANIQAGCRAGVCGADPIAVTGGADCLGPVGSSERATLERLGHAPNTRMACMARVRRAGQITVELKPHACGAPGTATAPAPVAMPLVAQAATSAAASATAKADASIRQIVIVGNGVAGLTAAEHVRRHHPQCEIHLISRETHAPYNRIGVSGLISNRTGMQGMQLKNEHWFRDQRVTQWLNTRATRIDTAQRRVQLATGEALDYDRLIIASGANAWAPPMGQFQGPGAFVLRDANDGLAIREYSQQPQVRGALVLGAGLLGIEAAAALRQIGLDVLLLTHSDQVLDRQVDGAASELIISHLQRMGIETRRNTQIETLVRDPEGRLIGARLKDGHTLHAELIVACTGTRADVALAREAGLKVERGIVVDAQMRTSAPDVYAAGDVAEYLGQMPGLWAIAAEQAEVAALNALGLERRYQPSTPITALKLKGIQVRSAGVASATQPGQSEWLAHSPHHPSAGVTDYCKLVVAHKHIIGAVIVGDDEAADELLDAVREGATLDQLRAVIGHRRWHKGGDAAQPRRA